MVTKSEMDEGLAAYELRRSSTSLPFPTVSVHDLKSKIEHVGTHKPKNSNGGDARIFAPKVDLRETAKAYLIEIELPGIHDVSFLTISWRSERELLVSGAIERLAIGELFSQSHEGEEHPPRNGDNRDCHDLESGILQDATMKSSQAPVPAYIVADEASGFEKNEGLIPAASSTLRHNRKQICLSHLLTRRTPTISPSTLRMAGSSMRETTIACRSLLITTVTGQF